MSELVETFEAILEGRAHLARKLGTHGTLVRVEARFPQVVELGKQVLPAALALKTILQLTRTAQLREDTFGSGNVQLITKTHTNLQLTTVMLPRRAITIPSTSVSVPL